MAIWYKNGLLCLLWNLTHMPLVKKRLLAVAKWKKTQHAWTVQGILKKLSLTPQQAVALIRNNKFYECKASQKRKHGHHVIIGHLKLWNRRRVL